MFLGIDIGTSGVKAIALADDGSLRAAGTAPLAVHRPQPFWSEQEPDDWWAATEAAVMALPARALGSVEGDRARERIMACTSGRLSTQLLSLYQDLVK